MLASSRMQSEADVLSTLWRLGVAAALGAAVGWNRERREKPAGLRTHMLVALGAASFMALGFDIGRLLPEGGAATFDPSRVLQGLIGGIGFLCAGAILQSRGRVTGITTAAGLWVSGAIGAASGLGAYAVALLATLLTVAILAVLGRLESSLTHSQSDTVPKRDGQP